MIYIFIINSIISIIFWLWLVHPCNYYSNIIIINVIIIVIIIIIIFFLIVIATAALLLLLLLFLVMVGLSLYYYFIRLAVNVDVNDNVGHIESSKTSTTIYLVTFLLSILTLKSCWCCRWCKLVMLLLYSY